MVSMGHTTVRATTSRAIIGSSSPPRPASSDRSSRRPRSSPRANALLLDACSTTTACAEPWASRTRVAKPPGRLLREAQRAGEWAVGEEGGGCAGGSEGLELRGAELVSCAS